MSIIYWCRVVSHRHTTRQQRKQCNRDTWREMDREQRQRWSASARKPRVQPTVDRIDQAAEWDDGYGSPEVNYSKSDAHEQVMTIQPEEVLSEVTLRRSDRRIFSIARTVNASGFPIELRVIYYRYGLDQRRDMLPLYEYKLCGYTLLADKETGLIE